MTLWHSGREVNYGIPIDAHFDCQIMGGKYIITVILSENKVYYCVHYWKGAETLHTPVTLLFDKTFGDAKTIQLWKYERDGYMQFSISYGDRVTYKWINPADLEEIKELEKPESPKLIGCSRRQCLKRAIVQDGYGWEHPYLTNMEALHWYEDEMINYGFNYVRHDACNDTSLTVRHCKKMIDNGKTVELTLWGGNDYMCNVYEVWRGTKDFPNIIYEPVNEFLGNHTAVGVANELTDWLVDRGATVSCGAWGRGGADLSAEYDPIGSRNQIISHHRQWVFNDIAELVKYKPVLWNEFFSLSTQEVKFLMRGALKKGVMGVNYLPIDRWNDDSGGRLRIYDYWDATQEVMNDL